MNRSYHIIYIIISEWLFNMLKHRNFIQFHHYKPPQKSQTYPICGAMKSQVNSRVFPKKAASGWSCSRGSGRSPKSGAGVGETGETKQPRDFKQYQTYNWLDLVGGFKHCLFFHHIWDVIPPIDELIFFRGVGQPPSSINMVNLSDWMGNTAHDEFMGLNGKTHWFKVFNSNTLWFFREFKRKTLWLKKGIQDENMVIWWVFCGRRL